MQKKKVLTKISILLNILLILTIIYSTNIYAHSGRTDKNGGHKDNKNVSGLGNYHYHCGGYEAHLHPNGVCPYKSKSNNTSSNTTKSTNSNTTSTKNSSTTKSTSGSSSNTKTSTNTNTKTTTTTTNQNNTTTKTTQSTSKPTIIEVQSVAISNSSNKTELLIDETIKLTAAILPENATNKIVTWSSSDKNIATVDSEGRVKAMSEGEVIITAKGNNSKQDTLKLVVKRKPVLVDRIIINNAFSKLKVNDEIVVETSVLPENAEDKDVIIMSSNDEVVRVENNKVKGVSSGDAIITIDSKDGNATMSFKVVVEEVVVEEEFNNEVVENKGSLNESAGDGEDGSVVAGVAVVGLGLCGVGGYKLCNKKKND